jgi:hypothetical protein
VVCTVSSTNQGIADKNCSQNPGKREEEDTIECCAAWEA